MRGKPWPDSDVRLLVRLHGKLTSEELVAKLGGAYTALAIRTKACRLGLKKTDELISRVGRENVRNRWPAKKPA